MQELFKKPKKTEEDMQHRTEHDFYLQEYMESILRGLVREPQRVSGSVRVICSFELRAIEVDLNCFEKQDRARLIGTKGETATAVRGILKSACALRRWQCYVHYADSDRALSDKEMHRYGLPSSALSESPQKAQGQSPL